MARIKKFGDTRLEKLSTFQTFLVDNNPNSTYFRISEFKDTFSGGKNGFLIEGSEFLKETTEIKIEILDVEGNPIYFEPGDGIPEYYEGVSKLVSVHIYEDVPIGIGKITILGELKNFLDNGDVIRPVPDDWKGLYNVKWERDFKINRLLSNEDKVRFVRRPVIEIQEISRPIFTATPSVIQQSGIVNGLPIIPAAGTRLADFSLPTTYLLTIADNSNWTASVVGNPIILPNLGVQLQSSDLITNKQLSVSTPYVVGGIVQPFFNQPYSASFNFLEQNSTLGTALSGSFAKIDITDLTSFVGDVARVKVFRKSQSEVSDFQFVQEIPLESNEILIDLESSQRNQEVYGLFTPFVLENYWVTSSNSLTIDFNQDFLYNSVELNSSGTTRFSTIKNVPINLGIEYTFGFNVRLEENLSANNSIVIYVEGVRNGLTTKQLITTIQSSNGVLQKSNINVNFIAEELQNAKLFFEVTGNGWYISDVSIRASQESAFSPDEITFIQPVPRTLETETFDFRFEFYDINNNFIPVLVEKTQTFDGGNLNRIAKSIELAPSSLYFQFDSGSGTGNPLPPTAIFIDVIKQFLTGSTNFTSRSFDFDNNELSASVYIGEQYPGLLIEDDIDRFRLTVQNFTGSKDDTVIQYIEYIAECEGVSDTIVITRVSDGKGGVNFEIRPFRGTVIRNKDELATLEVQAVRIDGINETNLVSGLPLNQSDTKLFVQSGSQFLTITEASSSGFLLNVVAGTTGSGELDYNAVFDRESIVGQLVLFLIPSSSLNREESIVSTLTLTDILDGLDAGFIQYDIDVFTINPRTEVVFTPVSASVTGSYHRRGTTDNPISASVVIYPSMSIDEDFIPQFWMNYFTGSINSDIIVTGFDEVGNLITPILPTNFVGDPLFQNKQLTLSFNYIEPFTSESVLVEHTFNIIPEGLPGKDAIVYEIAPPNVSLNANPNGTIFSFEPSATEIKVKQGLDYLAFTGSRRPGTFFISQDSVIGSNVTPGLVNFDNSYTQSLLISASTAFTELSGSIEYILEVHPFFTSSFFSQSLVQPYVKLLDGDGARSVTLEASSNIVNFNGNGNVISPEGDIILTANVFGATGSLHYQFYRDSVPYSTIQTSNIFEVGSGDAAAIGQTLLWSVEVRDGSPTSEVRAVGSTTIAGVQGGADSYNVQLTNENSSVVSSVFDVLTFSGSGTDILATKGDVSLQAVTSFSSPEFDQLGVEIPNGEYIVKIASKSSYITLAGGLVSGSTVPVVSDIARIGDITVWNNPRVTPTAQIVYEVNLENGRRTTFKTQSLSVQFEGDTGPGIVFRGEWTGSINYIYNVAVRRRDAVLRNVDDGVHYWATTELLVTASSPPFTQQPVYPAVEGETDAGGWEYLGEQDLFVAAKIAIFEESFVKNTINVGNNPGSAFANIVIAGGRIDPYIAVGQNGTIGLDGDQTGSGIIGYDRPGIFMGTFDSASIKTPRFSLKNGVGDRFLRWDGANLDIAGNINITGGDSFENINSLSSSLNSVSSNLNNLSSSVSNITSSAPIVDAFGKITFAPVPTGTGLFLTSDRLGFYDNDEWKTYMDNTGQFYLTGSGGSSGLSWDGNDLSIDGTVIATDGLIGGWDINTDTISKTSAAGTIEINSSDLGFFIKDTANRNSVIITDDISFRITGSTSPLSVFSGTGSEGRGGPIFGQNLQSQASTTFNSVAVSTGQVAGGTEISIAGSTISTMIANSAPTAQWLDRGTATFVQTYHWISLEVVGVGQALMASGFVFWNGVSYNRRFTSTGGASIVIPSTGTYDVRITHQIGVNYLIGGESITLKTPSFAGINAVVGTAPRSVEINQAGLQSLFGSNQFKVDTSLSATSFLTVRGKSEFSGSSNFTSLNASEANITNLTVGSISISDGVFTINGDIRATGDIYALASSDERLKDNIILITNPIDKIKKLGGYTFNWNDISKKPTHIEEVGVIAQEVQKVLPQIVREKGDGYLGVDYEKIVPLLIEGIKEQQNQIDELKAEVSLLNNIISK